MKIVDLSRTDGIGASCQWLEIGPFRVMIDAGLDPKGVGLEATPCFEAAPYEPADAIVLTHCHLDHLGSLPLAAQRYPAAPILCSRPSEVLAPRMLRNSANVMKRQRVEQGISEYPLYGRKAIDNLDERLIGLDYRKPFHLEKDGKELTITLYRAGHIVGAAGVLLSYKHRQIFVTGDVLFGPQRTLPGADFPDFPLDTLIMETTRGSTERAA
ncbi:MAG: MBL fold metallo-hydrolase [Opitutales bacterium]